MDADDKDLENYDCVSMALIDPTVRRTFYSLFRYAYTGNLAPIKDFVEILMEERKGYLEKALGVTNENGMCALHFAASGGSKLVCKYLLETEKVDINTKDTVAGETPLHHAILKGRFPTAVFLLQNGADPNVRTKKRRTALHYAVEHGSKELVLLLISKGADVNVVADCGTPLQCAAGRAKEEFVKLLLAHHADPNAISHDLFSPLLASIRGQSLECMEQLLKAGADPNFSASKGVPPLEYAVSEGSKEIIRRLLNAGADPNAANVLGITPVEKAALRNKRGLVRILFPLTSPLPTIPQWSISSLFEQVHSENAREEREQKLMDQFFVSRSKGDECFNQKDYFGAIQWYTQATSFSPNDAGILSAQSQCWGKMNEGGLALECAEACIKLRPNWPDAYYLAGTARMLLKEYKMAASTFQSGLKLDPENKMLAHALREAIEATKIHRVIEF